MLNKYTRHCSFDITITLLSFNFCVVIRLFIKQVFFAQTQDQYDCQIIILPLKLTNLREHDKNPRYGFPLNFLL